MASEQASALLFTGTDSEPADEAALTEWYFGRHLGQRSGLPGFISARGFEAVDGGPKYLAVYELAGLDALQTPEYKALSQPPQRTEHDAEMAKKFKNPKRVLMTQIAQAGATEAPPASHVGGLLVVALEPEAGYEDEFNDWYNTEHIVYGAAVPGVLRIRRYKSTEGSPPYLALWDLADPNVPNSPAFRKAVDTPWTFRMRKHDTRIFRGIYKPR